MCQFSIIGIKYMRYTFKRFYFYYFFFRVLSILTRYDLFARHGVLLVCCRTDKYQKISVKCFNESSIQRCDYG